MQRARQSGFNTLGGRSDLNSPNLMFQGENTTCRDSFYESILSRPIHGTVNFISHIYCTLLNRSSFLGLMREIALNCTFILLWILTFKNARRIDPSIRPHIHVKLLEKRDQQLFDYTILGFALQIVVAFYGALWVYVLTGKNRLAALGAMPVFLLNLLHTITYSFNPVLDVCAWLSYGVIHFVSPFLCALWLCKCNTRP